MLVSARLLRQVAQHLLARFIAGRRWTAVVFLALVAIGLWSDRHGLEARYTSHLGARTIWRVIDPEVALDPELPAAIFRFPRLFRVRWSGWIDLDVGGVHRWRVTGGGVVRVWVDGAEVVVKQDRRETRTVRTELEAGLHLLEIELEDSGGGASLTTEMHPPSGDWGALPSRRLYPRRPGPVKRLIRAVFGGVGSVARNALATALAALALGLAVGGRRFAAGAPKRWAGGFAGWARAPARRGALELGAIGLCGVAAGLWVFPRTGSPFGWDDVRYMDLALFNKNVPAYLNRYAHVYLVKLFTWMAAGDPFLGARLLWSAELGVIVSSLALAARSLGGRRWVPTFALAVVVLLCQPLFFVRAGASVPDTTVAALVMAAVALYLHRRARPTVSGFDWAIFAIGAMTLWAVKSKELGAILLWLPVLFLFTRDRLDPAGFVRRMAHWIAGAVAALTLLLLLDGIFLGDPLHAVRPSNLSAVGELNFAADPQLGREREGWIQVLAAGKSPVAGRDPGMRFVALAVILAALVAAHRRRSIELSLLHLLPVLYVLVLMLIHARATYVFLARYLYPMMPLAGFLVAAAFHYLGLGEIGRRRLRRPGFLAATAALAFLVFGIVLPYLGGRLAPGEFLPAAWLAAADWTSLDVFVRLIAAPALVLVLVGGLVLFYRRPGARLLLLLTLLLLFLGQPLRRTLQDLEMSRPWQRGETNLHGLRVLADQIPSRTGVRIEVSPSLMASSHWMFGVKQTCREIVKLYLRRRDLVVDCFPTLLPEHDVAFLTPEDYAYWRRVWPGLAATAVACPGGEVTLVRPSAAAAVE